MTKVIDSDKCDEIDIRRIESNGELDILPHWPERAKFVFSVIERIRKNTTKDSGFENKAIWLAKAENNPQVLKHLVLNPKVKERMNIREKSQKSRFFFKIKDPGKIKNLIETCFSIIQDARDYNTDYENVFYNGKIDDLERLFNFFTYIYYRIDEKHYYICPATLRQISSIL